MSKINWSKYSSNEINDLIKYWTDIWEDLCDSVISESIEHKNLISAHLTLINLKNEISERGFFSSDLINIFYAHIGYLIGKDPIISKHYKHEFKVLYDLIKEKKDLHLVIKACNHCLTIFLEGKYFGDCIESLQELLKEPIQTKFKEKITSVSYSLIIELFLAEYSIKLIRDIPTNIFDKYYYIRSDFINTKFPLPFTPDDYSDYKDYAKDVESFFLKISIIDRINAISHYFSSNQNEGIFIFNLNGVIIKNEMKLNDIHFYLPSQFRYLDGEEREAELFQNNENDAVNAAVFLRYRDPEISKQEAILKINSVFDILRLYTNSEAPLQVDESSFIIVKDGSFVQGNHSFGPNHKMYSKFHSLNLHQYSDETNNVLVELIKSFLDGDIKEQGYQKLHSIIQPSLMFYRKGYETDILNTKHLNYWISIENIVKMGKVEKKSSDDKINESPIDLAKKILPPLVILDEISTIIRDLYYYIFSGINNSLALPTGEVIHRFDIDEKIQSQYHLNPGNSVNLINFLHDLQGLLPHIKEKILIDKIEYVQNIYFDKKEGENYVNKREDEISNDITFINQIRNQIVHKAYTDPHTVFFYTNKAEKYCNLLLRHIINENKSNPNNSLESILYQIPFDYRLLKEKMKEGNFTLINNLSP